MIGRRIVMNEKANNQYRLSKAGSTGTILGISDSGDYFYVDFDYFSGDPDWRGNPTYSVAVHCCTVLDYKQSNPFNQTVGGII